jgi:hypothetical protein
LPEGATLAPVIIVTDKMHLTQFSGDKSAYPVYLTIGNLPKEIHQKPMEQGCILIGYLSVKKNPESQRFNSSGEEKQNAEVVSRFYETYPEASQKSRY